MNNFWDDRYNVDNYVFGEEPNLYFKEKITNLSKGKILLPAEGEGRNAVYAAKLGWNVCAYDTSSQGQRKALKLAEKNQVNIDYQIGEINDLHYYENQFDAIALIYAHFQIENQKAIYQKFNCLLKKGGYVIFEAFSKNNLNYIDKYPNIGGPKDINLLFSLDNIKGLFTNGGF